jgi:hypothetical protein
MPARRLALLGILALLCLAPLAAAGTMANPETPDDSDDDVAVNGGANCMSPAPPPAGPCVFFTDNDFEWANSDVDWAWVNDTATDLVFTAVMKANPSFVPGAEFFGHMPTEAEPFTYTFQFAFTVDGNPFVAQAIMGTDGVFTLGGVAASFLVHDGNQLTVTVPKDVVKADANGAAIGTLVFSSHGADDHGNTLDDQVPNAGTTARDYTVANGTAPAAGNVTTPANNTGSASSGTGGSAVTGSSTGPTRGPVSGTTTRTTTSATGPSTGRFGLVHDGKKSPGLALPLLGLAVAGVALALRRRL